MFLTIFYSVFCFQLYTAFAAVENVCEGWEVYNEQKCIKLFTTVGLQSFAEAEKTCSENGNSRLVSVNFAEKQTFLVEYLFTKKATVDSVWLGAKYDNVAHRFHWEDSSGGSAKLGFTFTNWAAKNPKNDSLAESCVQMHSEREIRGQWANEPCTKKNLVLCERAQNWSNAKMQEVIVEMMLNQVPLGFIYVQLPQEKSPQEIWPWMSWSDVSAQFDSTFFRVAGKKAEAFGKTQPEAVPFIDTAEYIDCQQEPRNDCAKLKAEDQYQWVQKIPQSGGWSGRISTTSFYDFANAHQYRYRASLRFHVTPSEVRPKNMAVKVWKRTG